MLKAGPLRVSHVSSKLNLANYIRGQGDQREYFWIVAVTGPGVPVRVVTFSTIDMLAAHNAELDAKVPEAVAFGRGFQDMVLKPDCGGFHSPKEAELSSLLKIPSTMGFYNEPIGTDVVCKTAFEYLAKQNDPKTRKMGTAQPIELEVGLTDGTEYVLVPVKLNDSALPGKPACMDIEKAYALTK